jgi:dihydrofolate reductase
VFRTSQASAGYLREAMSNIKAVIGGRRVFEVGGWGPAGHPFGAPIFVVTHSVPEDWPAPDWPLPVTFVTDGVRGAVEQAAAAAGAEGWIGVCGPDIIQQCLREGLLDELRIDLVPAFLGDGIRFFDGLPADVARPAQPARGRGRPRDAPDLPGGTLADPVPQVRGVRRHQHRVLDQADRQRRGEQRRAHPQHDRREVQPELVDQALRDRLPDDLGAAHQRNMPVPGPCSRPGFRPVTRPSRDIEISAIAAVISFAAERR